jgi:hypothetical protein
MNTMGWNPSQKSIVRGADMLTYYEDEGVIVTLSDEGFARLAAEAAHSTRTARRH